MSAHWGRETDVEDMSASEYLRYLKENDNDESMEAGNKIFRWLLMLVCVGLYLYFVTSLVG